VKTVPGKRTVGVAVGIAFTAFLGYRLAWYRPLVAVIAVEKAEIHGKVHGPGTVQCRIPVAVGAQITGILEKLYADQGDLVQRGRLLAELDAVELKARVAAAHAAQSHARWELVRARADLVKSEASLALAQSNYRRDLALVKPGYISQAAFDTMKAAFRVAQSEVAASQATVSALQAAVQEAASEARAAEALFGYTRILAPMTGLVTVRKAEVGDTVSPGTPIFQIIDLDQVWVAAWIDETKIAHLHQGEKATITLRSGRIARGEVVRVNKEADTITRELEVDVRFAGLPDPLVIGEEAEVDIDTGTQRATVVPLSAILTRNGHRGVLAADKGRVRFQEVSVGLRDGENAAISGGLMEGDLVVVNPAGLEVGRRIHPRIRLSEARRS
jgi:HlyD family secretion protein